MHGLKFSLLLPALLCHIAFTQAQTDTIPGAWAHILSTRQALRGAFESGNTAGAQICLDTMPNDPHYTPLLWDERWMLYYWLEDYSALLEEVQKHSSTIRNIEQNKPSPPDDGLFPALDNWLYTHQQEIAEQVRAAGLSQEEQDFLALHLIYMLRAAKEGEAMLEQDRRLEAFKAQYPGSRFLPFIKNFMYSGLHLSKHAFGLEFGLLNGNWSDELERTMPSMVGIRGSVSYRYKRWNALLSLDYGSVKTTRAIPGEFELLPKKEHMDFQDVSLELGYDVLDKERLRLFPSVGIGSCGWSPSSPGEGEEPPPAYYDDFYYTRASYTAALNLDLKFYEKNAGLFPHKNYHGIRVRAGYRWLNFDKDSDVLGGNMFFFAVSGNLFFGIAAHKNL